MTVTVKNTGALGAGVSNAKNTDLRASFGDQGTVRVIYQGREYVFGPNQSITFQDDGIGHAVQAQDARLRFIDTREGSVIGNPSITLRT